MTRTEAINKLLTERKLSTAMLEPLGISFEAWLRFAQASDKVRDETIERLCAFYETEKQGEQ